MSQKKRLMNEKPKTYTNLTREEMLAIKIVFAVICVILLGLLTWYLIECVFLEHEPNYFFSHFLACTCLIGVGVIAFIMPKLSRKSLAGENRGDQMMLVVALVAFLLAILSVILSYTAWA